MLVERNRNIAGNEMPVAEKLLLQNISFAVIVVLFY